MIDHGNLLIVNVDSHRTKTFSGGVNDADGLSGKFERCRRANLAGDFIGALQSFALIYIHPARGIDQRGIVIVINRLR